MSSSPSAKMPLDRSQAAQRGEHIDWPALEAVTHRDPGRRGLASYRLPDGRALDEGQLRAAALDLAQHATRVGIITGFCAVLADQVTAETDGPPGALYLARAFAELGLGVDVITDRFALPLLEAGCDALGIERRILHEFPLEDDSQSGDRWTAEFFAERNDRVPFSHLIAIERPGPSYDLPRLPPEDRNACHTMRGAPIDAWTAKTHRLFERIAEHRLPITAIAIGDGGNELGMGKFALEDIRQALASEVADKIACRIGADFALLAGVSNWGGYALALTMAKLLGADAAARQWSAAGQRRLIEMLIRETPAVDGVTLRREPTVDGLPLDDYLQPLIEMRRLLDLATPGE